MSAIGLLAHQGGWDEIALVGGPIVIIVVVLAIAKRRVDAQAPAGCDLASDPSSDTTDDPAELG